MPNLLLCDIFEAILAAHSLHQKYTQRIQCLLALNWYFLFLTLNLPQVIDYQIGNVLGQRGNGVAHENFVLGRNAHHLIDRASYALEDTLGRAKRFALSDVGGSWSPLGPSVHCRCQHVAPLWSFSVSNTVFGATHVFPGTVRHIFSLPVIIKLYASFCEEGPSPYYLVDELIFVVLKDLLFLLVDIVEISVWLQPSKGPCWEITSNVGY
jgi:hypothetical protein